MEERDTNRQLRPEERVVIAGLKMQGLGVRAIARTLGRSAGSISRELGRNASDDGAYESQATQLALDPSGRGTSKQNERSVRR